ncbi:MAG: hypothetical protein ABI856_17305, partial [Nitrospira sp.]
MKQRDAPLIALVERHEPLNCVDAWVEISLSRRHHADDCAEDRHFGRQKAYVPDDGDISGRLMVSEEVSE